MYLKKPIKDFLTERQAQVKEAMSHGPTVTRFGMTLQNIVVDPGNDIICDYCNAEIFEPEIHINDYGAICQGCRERKASI